MSSESITFAPVGTVHCEFKYRFETARQGVFAKNRGYIELLPRRNYEQALEDLDGFERIWVIFAFHLNHDWKPKVTPPVVPGQRRFGVFATRAPYRPNPVGISCVELEKVEGLRVYIRNFDMLDQTPVLDIKPYIPEADSFPESRAGWRDEIRREEYSIQIEDTAREKMAVIHTLCGLDMENFCKVQLIREPTAKERKRVEPYHGGLWTIGCRTWRIAFRAKDRTVEILDVFSNYSPEELRAGQPDPYHDKEFHRRFQEKYPV